MFNLLALPRPIPLRVFRTVGAIQSAAFERIDISERAGLGKVELENLVAVVEWCTRVCPQGRILIE